MQFSTMSNIQWSPKTLLVGVVTTALGALLTMSFGWIHNVGATAQAHGEKIARLDERTLNMEQSIEEIKAGQEHIIEKLDRVLQRGSK